MNYFSSELTELLKRKDANIYRLAKLTNVDRTTIQHIKSGSRTPTEDFVDKLSDALALTYSERSHLRECYIISEIGKKRYYERNHVKNLVESLADINKKPKMIQFSLKNDMLDEKTNKTIKGKCAIQNLLHILTRREIEESEAPAIITTIPFGEKTNVGMLLSQYLFSYENLTITHILRLYSEDENINDEYNNIAILQKVLKFSLNPSGKYLPYCYYTKQEEYDDFFLPFPYFYMTSQCVVIISADYQTAVCINSEDIYNTFAGHANALKMQCNKMVDTIDFMKYMQISTGIANRGHDADFGGSPCIGRFLSSKFIIKYLVEDLPFSDKLKKLSSKFYDDTFKKIEQGFVSFFMEEGLRNFAETGRLGYYPEFLVKDFTVEDRIYFLSKIRGNAKYFHMIREEKLKIPQNVIFEMNKEGEILISYIGDSQMRCCRLNDRGLTTPFYDFKDNVLLTELCTTKEEMIAAIDECLKKLGHYAASHQ